MTHNTPHILLINPWIHDFAAYDFWAKPLGLLIIAGILKAHGIPISYIDCLNRFHPRAPQTDPLARYGRGPYLKTRIPKPPGLHDVPRNFCRYGIKPLWLREDLQELPRPDLVLVTSLMTYWYPGVRETIENIRSVFPRSPIVLGGIYARLCPEHARSQSGADHLAVEPAETHLMDLVEKFTGFADNPSADSSVRSKPGQRPSSRWQADRGGRAAPICSTRAGRSGRNRLLRPATLCAIEFHLAADSRAVGSHRGRKHGHPYDQRLCPNGGNSRM